MHEEEFRNCQCTTHIYILSNFFKRCKFNSTPVEKFVNYSSNTIPVFCIVLLVSTSKNVLCTIL